MGIETSPAHSPRPGSALLMAPVRRNRLGVLTLVAVAALLGAVAAATSGREASGVPAGHVREDSFYSAALRGRMRFAVWVPSGYDAHSSRRYPVLYMLHGLPGGKDSYRSLLF